ncbi:hypothetical protein ACMFMF_006485 [Clarireedia jacksonii]
MFMNDEPSCGYPIPPSHTIRTEFGNRGCTIYGYCSTGGVLVKEANILDMKFLSLDRLHPAERSDDAVEEDEFCGLMRKLGATWWNSRQEWAEAQIGLVELTEIQKRVLVFGWPTDGVGVWVLRYKSEREVPNDFGRINLVITMDEKIEVMKEYGALFYEDMGAVEELVGVS